MDQQHAQLTKYGKKVKKKTSSVQRNPSSAKSKENGPYVYIF